MKPSDKSVSLVRLAMARQAIVDAGTQEVYLDELREFDNEIVAEACKKLARAPREEFDTAFPSLGAILAACMAERERHRLENQRLLAAKAPLRGEPTFVCFTCQDEPSGWAIYQCLGRGELRDEQTAGTLGSHGIRPCARMQDHGPHAFTDRCVCYPTNPAVHRERERMGARQTVASKAD